MHNLIASMIGMISHALRKLLLVIAPREVVLAVRAVLVVRAVRAVRAVRVVRVVRVVAAVLAAQAVAEVVQLKMLQVIFGVASLLIAPKYQDRKVNPEPPRLT